jgi:hypothetical protein
MTEKQSPKVGKSAGNRGKGRKKGVPNKTTALLKDAILKAAELAGKDLDPKSRDGMISYLQAQAKLNPGPFMGLLGKVLPTQLSADDDTGNVTVQIIKRTYADPPSSK